MKDTRYTVRLRHGNWVDNLYLSAPDTAEQDAKFADCLRSLKDLETSVFDVQTYRHKAIAIFQQAGFAQIAK